MNLDFIWQSLVIMTVGFILLRIAGKKTISEMTGLEIVTMLAIASVIAHAIAEKGLWKTIVTLCIFVGLLLTVQYLSLKFNWLEKWFIGKSTRVIQDGEILTDNLKKLRMTVDQLEAKLREKGITSYRDLKNATVEMNGQLGYEWMKHAKPVTWGDFEKLLAAMHLPQPPKQQQQQQQQQQNGNIFYEIEHQTHQSQIPKELD
ncbi:DUF421 domain-containing protein [Paenibacillus thermotolerans]|uniref:DUF421 domain-containing protein n=1 Tax=Paenibacillus thermotolerans TaxID=3027807 RepID=UPI0023682558|nr:MULTISPECIES: YetF domain-containing protein [unclassified Paenibacillus]